MIRRKFILLLFMATLYSFIVINNTGASNQSHKQFYVYGTVKYIYDKKFSSEYLVGDNLLVSKKSKKTKLKCGDIIEVYGYKADIKSKTKSDFDYRRYLKSRGINNVIEIKKYKKTGENIFYKIVGIIREKITIANGDMYRENSGLVNAVATGDKSGIDKKTSYIFMDSGTSHIMAISGLHVGIFLVISIVIIGNITNIYKFLAVLIAVSIYGILVGNSASIMRAVDLLFFSYLSIFLDERCDIVNTLSLIASIMIFRNPFVIFNVSFQLSFISVASISIFSKYIEKYVYGKSLSVSIAAMLGTAPLVLYYFKEVSLAGIISNVVAVPAIGVIVTLDFLSVIMYYLLPVIGYVFSFINSAITDMLMEFLKKVGNFGMGNIVCREIGLKYVIAYYIVIIFVGGAIYLHTINKNKIKEFI